MPTIEIISLSAIELEFDQADFDVALIMENKLVSHRGLFNQLLRKQSGTIIHIGNPDFIDDKGAGFFAGKLIDWSFDSLEDINLQTTLLDDHVFDDRRNLQLRFKFMDQYISEINNLLTKALDKSPVGKACFLTDYQFGPEKGKVEILHSINEFWKLHNDEGLDFNTLYEIQAVYT